MKIAIIGAGAMGMLFGGRLSAHNDVTLVDTDENRIRAIQQNGVCIAEPDESEHTYTPNAAPAGTVNEPMELVMLFVKANYSAAALEGSRALIGPNTLLLSLQNGAGHEQTLRRFAPENRVAIGVTQHNASLCGPNRIHHGGGGQTYIGSPFEGCPGLDAVAQTFTACGFETHPQENIKAAVWEKLMMNASSSALTGVLQARQGLCVDSPAAKALLEKLIREAVAVANAEGVAMDADKVLADIVGRLEGARQGLPSICADIRDGRKTEANTITGAVVEAARRNHVPAPTHEAVLLMLHALEDKRAYPQYGEI